MRTITRHYMEDVISERIDELHKRYRNYCNRIDDDGSDMTMSNAASKRHRTKRDLAICHLIEELMGYITVDFSLGEHAETGFELLLEPNEWRRARL